MTNKAARNLFIIGSLFFFVIFTLISLLSFHPQDPSIHSAGGGGRVQNLFGVVGAQQLLLVIAGEPVDELPGA